MTKLEERLRQWIKELKEGNPCIPHNSFDGGCVTGTNEEFRLELIKNLEYLLE